MNDVYSISPLVCSLKSLRMNTKPVTASLPSTWTEVSTWSYVLPFSKTKVCHQCCSMPLDSFLRAEASISMLLGIPVPDGSCLEVGEFDSPWAVVAGVRAL